MGHPRLIQSGKIDYELLSWAAIDDCVVSRLSSSTFSAMAYFSFSIPSPVTAEIGNNGSFFFLQYCLSCASLSLLATSIFEATMSMGFSAR
jgi:hypothetical protein